MPRRGGGSGGGGGTRGHMPRDVVISKKMSWVLRHGAVKEGLKLDENGYMNCADLVSRGWFSCLGLCFRMF